jgi:hypothetical protein
MKRLNIILILLILCVSFLLSSRMILAGDFFYLFDQARDYLLTKSIVENRDLVLIGTHSGLGGFFHGPLWLYMLVPIYILGNGSPIYFAYFYIGLQLTTVLVAYLIGSKLYGNKGGIMISLLIALSSVTWGAVSNTIGVNVEPLIFLGIFYFLIKFIRGNSKAFIFVAFFAGLSLQFETALPLVLIPTMIIVFLWNRIAVKNLKIITLSILSFILSISTFILFDLRHKFLMTNALVTALSGGKKEKGYLDILERFYSHINSLFGVYKSVLFNQDLWMTVIFVAILIFGAYLIFKSKEKYKKEFFFLLFFPVLVYLFFIFYPYPIWPDYVLGLLIPIAIVFYIATMKIWENVLGKILVITFFILTFLNVFSYLQSQYLKDYLRNNSSGSYLNQKSVIDWIYKDAGKGTFGYFVYTPEVYTHGTDYLISWYGKKYPQTRFENKKDTITYLILAPHLTNDEGAYAFWKKNTIRTNAKVVLTKTFNGNITVQKLSIDSGEPDVDPNYYQGLMFR